MFCFAPLRLALLTQFSCFFLASCAGLRGDDLTAAFTSRAAAAAQPARILRVIDADTYLGISGGKTFRLRLLGVDAPESSQPFGQQAADSVGRLLLPSRVVLVAPSGLDLYGRTLGVLLLPTATLNRVGRMVPLDSVLVARGWAWAHDGERITPRLMVQQSAAQQLGRGLWKCGVAGVVPPKLWRSLNTENKRRYRGSCTW